MKTNVNIVYFPLRSPKISSRISKGLFIPGWLYKAAVKWMQIEYSFPLKTICIAYT